MRSLFRLTKRRFTEGKNYHYHHDFNPDYLIKNNVLNFGLAGFELGRITYYFTLCICLIYSAPLYLAFRRNKHIDNPDYMLDQKALRDL